MEVLKMFESSKFVFGMSVIMISAAMVWTGHITAQEWISFVSIIGGSYIAVHQSEKAVDRADEVAKTLVKGK